MSKPKILKSNLSIALVLIIVGVLFLYSFNSTGKFTGVIGELSCAQSSGDIDLDGLPDNCETIFGTNKVIADTDGDGCSDGTEAQLNTDALDIYSYPDNC
jgi:hypothetical protein